MIIMALDLSMSSTGYCVLQWDKELQLASVLTLGHIDNKHKGMASKPHGQRLSNIYRELAGVMKEYDPDVVVREKGVTRFNKATQVIFRVVGVADLAAYTVLDSVCEEIGITEAKKLITGSGKAEKDTVATEVQKHLELPVTFAVDDESDAVAVGVAYCLKTYGGN